MKKTFAMYKGITTFFILAVFFSLSSCGGGGGGAASDPGTPTFTKSLSWAAVTTNADGTALAGDLAGYKVYIGTATRNYPVTVDVSTATSYKVENLEAGNTYYFAVTAYDNSTIPNESAYSNEVFEAF